MNSAQGGYFLPYDVQIGRGGVFPYVGYLVDGTSRVDTRRANFFVMGAVGNFVSQVNSLLGVLEGLSLQLRFSVYILGDDRFVGATGKQTIF